MWAFGGGHSGNSHAHEYMELEDWSRGWHQCGQKHAQRQHDNAAQGSRHCRQACVVTTGTL